MVNVSLPNGVSEEISPKKGLITLNILKYFPGLKEQIIAMQKALPQFIQQGKSPKAAQTFGKFNSGLYRNVGKENPIAEMKEISAQIQTLPGYETINDSLQRLFSDMFSFNIEDSVYETQDHNTNIVAPHYVWRDLTGGSNGVAAGFHLDDILRDVSLFGPEHYNRLPFLKDLRNGEQDPYTSIEVSRQNQSAVDNILERQRFISKTFTQLAFNLFVSIPESGGETDIAFPQGVEQYVGNKIGDLAIFCSQAPHQIRESSVRGDKRYTMAGFIGVNKDEEKGYQFG